MEEGQTTDKTDEERSLGSLFQSYKKKIAQSKKPIKYQIVSVKKQGIDFKLQPKQSQTKNLYHQFNLNIQEKQPQNLANKKVSFDQFSDSSSIYSSESSFISRLTVTNDKIQYKVNIIGNLKYQILQNQKQGPNFKKIPQQKAPQNKFGQNAQLKQITIQNFFNNKNSWNQLDKINKTDPGNQVTYMLYREILNSDKIIIDQSKHQDIKTKIIQESQKNKNSYFTILLGLQQYLKSVDPTVKVIFCQKSSLKTQVSMKLISTGFAFQKFKCSERIKQKNLCRTFQDIIQSQKNYQYFEEWYSKYFQTQHLKGKKQPANIKLTSISKLLNGGLCVQWDTYQPQIILRNPNALKRIKVRPYFNKFYLSMEDFDTERGNISFPEIQNVVHRRGNYPYFPPQNCSRYSIKVWDKFDSENNQWLQMKNGKNQWPSAYFGLYNPKITQTDKNSIDHNSSFFTDVSDFQHILVLKNTLIDTKCINCQEKVGQGIICTPYMWNALQDTQLVEVNGQKYVLVFQCRLNPKKLKITQKEQYWMINQFSDVRPYGIILVPLQVKISYPQHEQRFKQDFSYLELKGYLQRKYEPNI